MRWFGKIGFGVETDKGYGSYEKETVDKNYYGDLTRSSQRAQYGQTSTNAEITLNNELQIVADKWALAHIHDMVYAEIAGAKWNVLSVEEHYPRLYLTIGGVYHE
jgi:hypothetical protein